MQKDMTKGNPMPIILQFTWPLFLGNVFQQVYNAVDSMIVGRFVGSGALAAVGSTGTIMFLVIGAATGLSTGFTVLTSQRYGIHDEEGIKKSVANGMLLSAAVIILMTVSSLLGMKGILRLLNTPENIFEDAYTYISIICAGIIASVAYNFFSACLRAIGNSKVPLVTLIFSACLNVVLDLALIVGLKMGVAGAAAAMFTTKTDIPNVNEDHIIGWVGGMDIPVLHDFYTGYEQGAKYIDPDIKILQAFAGSWTDPLKGKELTLAQYEQGADIVMNVASGTGVGILEGAKEADKYAIGVDLNQDSDQPGHILTSMVKRVDNACYLVIQSAVDGTFEGGTTKYLALKDGGVSLTDFSVIKESLGDKFPQDIVDKCDELAEKIKSGEIVVENYEGFGPEA